MAPIKKTQLCGWYKRGGTDKQSSMVLPAMNVDKERSAEMGSKQQGP
jgi:hypothetical protein